MSSFDFDASDLFNHLDIKEKATLETAKQSVEDSLDDLKRIATNIAPISLSSLRKSADTRTEVTPQGVAGELNFSIIEKTGSGRFNYALWIHEMEYELGEKSQAAGGTDGYSVGNKYVERPLKGESEKYIRNWASNIARRLDG